ncbi:MAG: hypothetical protein QOI26_2476 [Pseudonocardiales bacterium]|nr:hypothetical protein [Pseudonocardiales bacterium]
MNASWLPLSEWTETVNGVLGGPTPVATALGRLGLATDALDLLRRLSQERDATVAQLSPALPQNRRHPDRRPSAVGMCDSARCPQPTHHPIHRRSGPSTPSGPKPSSANLAGPAPSSATVYGPTTTGPCASSPRSTPRPHPHPTRTPHENQRGPTNREPQPHPGGDGPAPARRDPARRQLRHQDPGPRSRRRPHGLLRQPALRSPANRVRGPRPATATDQPGARPAHCSDHPAESRHQQAQTPPGCGQPANADLTGFRGQAQARLAAQHDEITRLRSAPLPAATTSGDYPPAPPTIWQCH